MNKHWELIDGKVVKKARYPKPVRTSEHSCNGLTLSATETRSLTFTVEQLRRAATTNKLVCTTFDREQIKNLIINIVRENRWELFGSYINPYKIVFNGYGQLSYLEDDNKRVTLDTLFSILEERYKTA